MPSLIGSLLGGAAVGYGAQVAEEGKAAREAALRMAMIKDERAYQDSRDEKAYARQAPIDDLQKQKLQYEVDRLKSPNANVPDSAQLLEYRAKQGGLVPGTDDYKTFILNNGSPSANSAAKYGVDPKVVIDKDGNKKLLAVADNGTSKLIDMPADLRLSEDTYKVDTGTEIQFRDRKTGEILSSTPKNNYQSSFDKATGTVAGKNSANAQYALPQVLDQANTASTQIDDLINDPYLDNMLGPMDSRTPDLTASAQRVASRIEQLKGGVFMQAREALKGAGQITDFEGKQAEKALARINRGMNPEDFKQALQDYKDIIDLGVARARARAGGAASDMPNDQSTYSQPQSGQQAPVLSGKTKGGLSYTVEGK